MDRLHAELRQIAEQAAAARPAFAIGNVTEYDEGSYAVKVQIQPSGVELGWLPLRSPWVGNGWGMFLPPSIGDPVSLHFDGGVIEAAFAGDRTYTDDLRPLPVPSGEAWIVHQSGAFVKLTNQGTLRLSDGHGANITLNGDGTITSTGTWLHDGDFTVTQTITADTVVADSDVIAAGKSGAHHTHIDSRGGPTGGPV